jgi:serine/threonine protein kinase
MGGDEAYARVQAHFLEIRALPPGERDAAVSALADPVVRAEVASLLAFDCDDAAFMRPRPAPPPAPAAAARPPPPLVGEVLLSRFEVLALAGEGGFGWVYRGHDLARDEPVAVKVSKPITDAAVVDDVLAAFEREGKALAALARRSPHIVEYRDVGSWLDAEGRPFPYIVMEWLAGPTLAELQRGRPALGLDEAMDLLRAVAMGLAVVHAHGVAHRDLKPSNVLCVPGPDGPVLRVLDFGAAKIAAERARGFESTGGQVGMLTFDYAAPELLSRAYGPTGPWTDVFSLAMMLTELLLGRHPWAGLDTLAAMAGITDVAARPTPGSLGAAVEPAVDAVMDRALAVEPSRRHPDAGAFWQALEAARRGEPTPGARRGRVSGVLRRLGRRA